MLLVCQFSLIPKAPLYINFVLCFKSIKFYHAMIQLCHLDVLWPCRPGHGLYEHQKCEQYYIFWLFPAIKKLSQRPSAFKFTGKQTLVFEPTKEHSSISQQLNSRATRYSQQWQQHLNRVDLLSDFQAFIPGHVIINLPIYLLRNRKIPRVYSVCG